MYRVSVIEAKTPLLDTLKLREALIKAVGDTVVDGKRYMQRYPPRMHLTRTQVYGKPFASDRQRRWFFAALKDGSLEVPYKRTGTLMRSWNGTVAVGPERIEGVIGSNSNMAPYNAYVQSEADQSWFMATIGWQTEQMMLEHIEPIFGRRVNAVFERMS